MARPEAEGLKWDNCFAGRDGTGHTFCGPGPHNSICGPGPGRVCTNAAGPGRAWVSNHIYRYDLPGLDLNFWPVQGPSTYYRRCISVPLVDHMLVELEARFSPHHRVAILGLCLVPSALVTLPDPDVRSHLAKLVDLYEEGYRIPRKCVPSDGQLENQVAEADGAA